MQGMVTREKVIMPSVEEVGRMLLVSLVLCILAIIQHLLLILLMMVLQLTVLL